LMRSSINRIMDWQSASVSRKQLDTTSLRWLNTYCKLSDAEVGPSSKPERLSSGGKI
jgi:hypothetical protein